ncbi:MAG TPA: carboxypeptidase-like regulatory domain-containing protein [Chitinophagaceae bacterium]
MRSIVLFILSFCSLISFAQRGSIKGQVKSLDPEINLIGLKVLLKQGDLLVAGTLIDSIGNFDFRYLESGTYTIEINSPGSRSLIDTVRVHTSFETAVNLVYPIPCEYVYKKGGVPACINGHKDQIIPILYGLPTPEGIKKSKKGKLFLGGCEVTDCDPQYYCKIHKRKL